MRFLLSWGILSIFRKTDMARVEFYAFICKIIEQKKIELVILI